MQQDYAEQGFKNQKTVMKRSIIAAILLSTLSLAAVAADLSFSPAEDYLRYGVIRATPKDDLRDLRDEMRHNMRVMEINREADRAIDEIRAREEADRQRLQRSTDEAILRNDLLRQQYSAPIRPRY